MVGDWWDRSLHVGVAPGGEVAVALFGQHGTMSMIGGCSFYLCAS
jgi:hypothetical protein